MVVPNDDNASEQAAKKASEQAISDAILKKAAQLLGKIASARTPEAVNAIIGELMALAGLVKGSGSVLQAISGAIASAQGRISELTQEEYTTTAMRIENSQYLDADTKKLYEGVDKFMTAEEKAYLNAINPEKIYEIAAFDKNGNLIEGTISVSGAELQEATIMLKAHEMKHELTKEQRESLNTKLHGHKDDPRTQEEHDAGKAKLKDAVDKVEGHQYAMARTPERKKAVEKRRSEKMDKINQMPFTPTSTPSKNVETNSITSATTSSVIQLPATNIPIPPKQPISIVTTTTASEVDDLVGVIMEEALAQANRPIIAFTGNGNSDTSSKAQSDINPIPTIELDNNYVASADGLPENSPRTPQAIRNIGSGRLS